MVRPSEASVVLVVPSVAFLPLEAVLEEQGFQCAFCMSGFIMNTVALLNENSSPTRKDAAEWLSGNLCRCADYDKILTSVMRAAEITRGA